MGGNFLASQQIRELIESGRLLADCCEKRIQPSSFEPTLSDELYILDTEGRGIFRQRRDETIYRTLLQIPGRKRKKASISDGFEIKKGFTYLAKLDEKIILSGEQCVKSSPKSSLGRLFLNSRMLTDYNPSFDEIDGKYMPEQALDMWLLLQPLAFNLIIRSGDTLNQIRIKNDRQNGKLLPEELIEEHAKDPLLCGRTPDGTLSPLEITVTDGLQVHLDLSGRNTEGIVGLRARHNPVPIDLSGRERYCAEEFFEPIKSTDGTATVIPGNHYLFATKEILKIPAHLNVELQAFSSIGITGPLHFAGFIDNGFVGDLVFEIRPDERANMIFEDGMPISRMDVYRTDIPDKLYGKEIGSHYQGQVGPKPSRYLGNFDYSNAARNAGKLNREVLTQDAKQLLTFRTRVPGFQCIGEKDVPALMECINNGFFQSRYDCEDDELILQPIPYTIIINEKEEVFRYVRAENIKDYGDARLFGKHSIGLGGHISRVDSPDFIKRCIDREVFNEEIDLEGNLRDMRLAGTLMAYDKPVDRVHLGLIYVARIEGCARPQESSIKLGGMVPMTQLQTEPLERFETWSRILIPDLETIVSATRR